MNMKFNNTAILTIFITVAMVIGILYFAAKPLWSSIIDIRQSEAKYESERLQLEQKVTTLRNLASERTTLDSYTKVAADLVPTEPKLDVFMIQLESLLNEAQLADANFDITELAGTDKNATSTNAPIKPPTPTSTQSTAQTSNAASPLKNTKSHQFSITGAAPLSKITNLLKLLKNMNRLIEINAVTINTTQSNDLTFQISGNAFSRSASSTQTIGLSDLKKLLDEANQYIANRASYGSPINPSQETGFGRANPFAPY